MRSFLEQHVGSVYRFALRLTGDARRAEDVAQETMLRAWRHRRSMRDDSMARPWMFRIAVNVWRDELRRERSRRGREQLRAVRSGPGWPEPERGPVQREGVERILAAMDELPPRQRQVLHLVACEELSIEAVASILEISRDAVKSSLSLARQRVRERLEPAVSIEGRDEG